MTLFLMLGTPEIIVIALVVLLLFGGRKLPELMRGLGHGVRDFKSALSDKDDKAESTKSADSSDAKIEDKDAAK